MDGGLMSIDFKKLLTEPTELHPDLVDYVMEGALGLMIHHPLVIDLTYRPGYAGWVNGLYKFKKERLADDLKKGEFASYVFLHERPYRFEAFEEIADKMGEAEYWKLLGEIWIDSENIRQHLKAWKRLWRKSKTYRDFVMETEEIRELNAMPDVITIYRGIQYKSQKRGISWTLSKEKAEWFANRWLRKNQTAKVLSGTIKKDKVLAYFKGRNEQEIVAFPNDVRGITEEIVDAKKTD
jgi:hypothetical protein